MTIEAKHPSYLNMLQQWETGNDSYEGAKAIKAAKKKYLPPTSGQRADGDAGEAAYNAYLTRAYYPGIYREAVDAAIGIMHRRPPTIELSPSLEGLAEEATLIGESLEMLLRKINARQLITGRIGLLGDIRVVDNVARPIIVTYNETDIINWHEAGKDLSLVILDESGYEMGDNFDWTHQDRYRVLALVDEIGRIDPFGVYATGIYREDLNYAPSRMFRPNVNGEPSPVIPFAFVNSQDLSPTPERPPLSALADLCLTIYRGEADYRQNLFMQSQDTLVITGANTDASDDIRTGAGARIDLNTGGDAKYIGVSSTGLVEQRQALENDYSRAIQMSGQLVDATSRAKESGDALRIRVAAQTATLPVIAKAGAEGLERVLKSLAVWFGDNPDDVSVTPNLEFSEADLNGQTIVSIMQAKALGAPISDESIHTVLSERGFTRKTYDEERDILEAETPAQEVPSPLDDDDDDDIT